MMEPSKAAEVGRRIGDALEEWGFAVPNVEQLGQVAIDAVESVLGWGEP